MLDEDRDYLMLLHDRLWPKDYQSESIVATTPAGQLTEQEWGNVQAAIERNLMVTSMFSSNMFGAYGMYILEHEPFPGTKPQLRLTLVEGNLPPVENPKPKFPGSGRDEAWEAFSRFTHSERNKGWLKRYKMEAPRGRGSYDY